MQAESLADLRVRGVRQDLAIEQHHRRQGHPGCPCLPELALSLSAVGRVEAERDPVAPEQFPELMGPCGPLLADDANHLQPGEVRSAPLVKLLGDKPVKVLVRWRPGLDDVGVDVTEDGRPQDRLRARLIAPRDEQHPPGSRVELPDPRQELCPRRFRQPLVS